MINRQHAAGYGQLHVVDCGGDIGIDFLQLADLGGRGAIDTRCAVAQSGGLDRFSHRVGMSQVSTVLGAGKTADQHRGQDTDK